MERSKYRQERILARGLCRPPGQDQMTFRRNVRLLREHFESFNVDVAEICQWLMGLRPDGKRQCAETKLFWDFFLSPQSLADSDEGGKEDYWRRIVCEVVAGWQPESSLQALSLSQPLTDSILATKAQPLTPTSVSLFRRLRDASDSHRMILLKSAAEWIASRFQRTNENWRRRHEEWDIEKAEWERKHPELILE